MLKSNVVWPDSRRFKSRSEWEPIGFFSEALCNATQFDLYLGFFSSSAINVLADSFASFLYQGGKMRMIINDILSSADKHVMIVSESDTNIPFFDLSNLESLSYTLSNRDKHFFECLAWLIKNERIEIKIVSPKEGHGISHAKCGLFSDGLNRVAFDGSCNFSRTALIENIESITAFCDWDGQGDVFKINDIQEEFNRTFAGNNNTVTYLSCDKIKTAITATFAGKDIKELVEDENFLISKSLDKELPSSISKYLTKAKVRILDMIDEMAPAKPSVEDSDKPKFPFSEPREYQKQAFENWKNNKQQGLFAMATGTGKTLTSLNCLLNIYKKYHFYKSIILVPTITLVDQWEQECKRFNFKNVVKVSSKNAKWKDEIGAIKLREEINDNADVSYVIIATYASFAREAIFKELMSFNKMTQKRLLFIADEAHNMGAGRILDRLNGIKFLRRIGLSATPERQYDDVGNKAVMNFFGCEKSYTFEYSMRDAIENGFLCRYYYYPHLVRLTDEEMSEYMHISTQLAKFYSNERRCFNTDDDIVMRLLLKRKRIIHKASNKDSLFKSILEQRYKEKGNLKYTLVYVPEGSRPDNEQSDMYDKREDVESDDYSENLIDKYSQIVLDVSNETTVKKFVSGIKERGIILDKFAKGEIEILTSMKCLDEGVDVPRSEMAIFCASTGNPRQFIQRRGRILRKHPDKHMAVIHDLVVVPEINSEQDNYAMERNLLQSELKRVHDFAILSENADFAYTELEDVTSYYNLSIF